MSFLSLQFEMLFCWFLPELPGSTRRKFPLDLSLLFSAGWCLYLTLSHPMFRSLSLSLPLPLPLALSLMFYTPTSYMSTLDVPPQNSAFIVSFLVGLAWVFWRAAPEEGGRGLSKPWIYSCCWTCHFKFSYLLPCIGSICWLVFLAILMPKMSSLGIKT